MAEETLEQRVPWIVSFPADVRGEDMVSWGKTPAEVATNVRNTFKERDTLKGEYEKLKSQPRGVMPLKPDSKPEDIAAYDKAFEVPEKPEGYKFTFPEGLPDGIVKPEDTKAFATIAKELHLPPAVAQKLADFETQRAVAAHNAWAKAQDEAAKTTAAALVEKYKDGADGKVKDALKAIEAFFGKEIRAKFEDKNDPMGNNLEWIEGAIRLSQFVTERGLPDSSTGTDAVGANGLPDPEKLYKNSFSRGYMRK